MSSWLGDAIDAGALIITASRRLARRLRLDHAESQRALGHLSWPTPPIVVWDEWCRRLLESADASVQLPLIIDGFSAGLLLEQRLAARAAEPLPAPGGIVRQARDAWQRINDWNVPMSALRSSARSPDERHFAAAATAYVEMLDERSWSDRARLPAIAAELLAEGSVEAPSDVVFAGFDRMVPAVQTVIDALAARGCGISEAPLPSRATALSVACCADRDAELRTAGAWARDILERSPQARIAVICPDLQNAAARSERLLREGLAPGWQYAGSAWRGAVNVSYGRRLVEYPAVADALRLLKIYTSGLASRDVSLLLRSRHLSGGGLAGRSRLELELRGHPDRIWQRAALERLLGGRDSSPDALAWLEALRDGGDALATDAGPASPADWAARIASLLDTWQWPGAAPDSAEFQLVNRWRDLLNELAGTALVTPRISLAEAVRRLTVRSAEVVFQPESEAGVVSLLGVLEAAGLEFDHAWITGLHSGLWPPPGNPSPLLSRALQREYEMPDASPADTLEFARRTLDRLTASAADVVLSWPRLDEEAELTVSSLLDDIPHTDYRGPADPGWHASGLRLATAIETIDVEPVPPVYAGEDVHGGAYTVQRQRSEPFTAFVHGRLGVSHLESIEVGVSPRTRGIIIHDALYELLADRPDRDAIRKWDAEEQLQRLGAAIDTALAKHQKHADRTLSKLLGLERLRLFRLLEQLLVAETVRPPFSIAMVEQKGVLQSGELRLDVRVDRVDRLDDGTMLVIDYKTGAPKNLLDRDGELVDLQLVAYAEVLEALDEQIGGLLLINVDSRDISYKGTGGSVEWDGGRRDEWPERLAAWRAELQATLRELAAGDVRLNLALSTDDSRPLAILSRIEELRHDA